MDHNRATYDGDFLAKQRQVDVRIEELRDAARDIERSTLVGEVPDFTVFLGCGVTNLRVDGLIGRGSPRVVVWPCRGTGEVTSIDC